MKLKLFTVLLEYQEGSYVAQVRAKSPASALAVWAEQLPSQGVPGIGAKTAEKLAVDLRDDPPVALNGLVSAWCASSLVRGSLALINIVLTVQDGSKP